jgi:branched-chain amino acid transport system substrate-binding protein
MLNSPGTHQIDSLMILLRSLGVNRVAIIHQGDDFTQNLSDISNQKLPANGFNIVTTQVMDLGRPDISAIVTAIRNADAEFVYWCGYFADGGNAIRQLRAGGFTGHIAVADGSASTELIPASGPAGEGVFVTSPPFIQFAEGGDEFMGNFQRRFNVPPDAYAPLAYDTVNLLAYAIERAGTTDTARVRDVIQNIVYHGLSGEISFTPQRELRNSNFMLLRIADGRFTRFFP